MRFVLLLMFISILCFPVIAIIPNADISSDRSLNVSLSTSVFNLIYDLNIKMSDRFALGVYSRPKSELFGSGNGFDAVYLKYLCYEDQDKNIMIGIYASTFRVEGQSSTGGFIGTGQINYYKYDGYNGGLMLSSKTDKFICRAALVAHKINNHTATLTYPETPFEAADPIGIDFAWLINPNWELNVGLSYFGFIGTKIKI